MTPVRLELYYLYPVCRGIFILRLGYERWSSRNPCQNIRQKIHGMSLIWVCASCLGFGQEKSVRNDRTPAVNLNRRMLIYADCFTIIGPRREKTCLRRFANNNGGGQPAHPRSLISAFVIRSLENIKPKLATSEISLF